MNENGTFLWIMKGDRFLHVVIEKTGIIFCRHQWKIFELTDGLTGPKAYDSSLLIE